MLPKQYRLQKTKDIQFVLKKGKNFFQPLVSVKRLPSQNIARFCFVVSTKVSKRATQRNYIRRLMREVVRAQITNIKPGDYVIFAKPQIGKEKNGVIIRTAVQSALVQSNSLIT